MQASKIRPHSIYAISVGVDADKQPILRRFRVDRIITERFQATGSPHDYQSSVKGFVEESNGTWSEPYTLTPDDILGPYQEYAELAEQERERKAKQEALIALRKANAMRLVDLLYEVTGLERPEKDRDALFCDRYGSGSHVEINTTAIVPMIDALHRLLLFQKA